LFKIEYSCVHGYFCLLVDRCWWISKFDTNLDDKTLWNRFETLFIICFQKEIIYYKITFWGFYSTFNSHCSLKIRFWSIYSASDQIHLYQTIIHCHDIWEHPCITQCVKVKKRKLIMQYFFHLVRKPTQVTVNVWKIPFCLAHMTS